jgi:hypothetical protein
MGPSYSTSSLKLYTGYHISIPRSAQSETVNDLRILVIFEDLAHKSPGLPIWEGHSDLSLKTLACPRKK